MVAATLFGEMPPGAGPGLASPGATVTYQWDGTYRVKSRHDAIPTRGNIVVSCGRLPSDVTNNTLGEAALAACRQQAEVWGR